MTHTLTKQACVGLMAASQIDHSTCFTYLFIF